MNEPLYVVDVIGDCVTKTNTAILAKLQEHDANIKNVLYLYGPPKEIVTTLTQMTNTIDEYKYPLVALFQSFTEKKGVGIGFDNTSNLRIIIGRWSDENDKAADRYINNFKPILYPVYMELMNQIVKDKRIENYTLDTLQYTKIDWPYWGGDDEQKANPFNDRLDIIEIRDLVLKFKNIKNC